MVALLGYAVRMLLTLRADGHDVVARALLPYIYATDGNAAVIRAGSIDALIQSIDDEVAEDQNQETGVPHVFEWCVAQLVQFRCCQIKSGGHPSIASACDVLPPEKVSLAAGEHRSAQ